MTMTDTGAEPGRARRRPQPRRGPRVAGRGRRAPAAPPRAAARRRREHRGRCLSSAFTMIAIVCLWVARPAAVPVVDLAEPRPGPALRPVPRRARRAPPRRSARSCRPATRSPCSTIPSIGLEQVVVEGTASGDLLVGPGHRRDTALPGQVGTSVVYGRAATYGGPFADLTELQAGDKIEVDVGQGRKVFRVSGVRRAGDPLPQPPADGAARLTLVTAEGSGRLGALAPESVVYVDADAKKGFPAPAGRPPAVPESEQSMARGHQRAAAAGAVPGPAPGADPRGHRRPSAMVDGARLGGREPPGDRAVLGDHGRGDAAPAQPDLTSDLAVSGGERQHDPTARTHQHHHHRK